MTEPTTENTQITTTTAPRNELRLSGPRLPYHPAIEERFGIDRGSWKFLTDVLYPTAEEPETVINVLAYCKARNLDVMKKPVHVVPVWDKKRKKMVDSVWPAIAEVRITAMRTGEYVGKGKTVFGPEITETLGGVEISYPESAQVTVYRLVAGVAREFHGEELRWKEFYAKAGRDTLAPNDMWKTKPYKQLAKCAEADALRAAFPEEAGSDSTAEEMAGQEVEHIYSAGDPVIGSGVRARLEANKDAPADGFNAAALAELGGGDTPEPEPTKPRTRKKKDEPGEEAEMPTQADVVAETRKAGYEAASEGAERVAPADLVPPLQNAWLGGYDEKVAELKEIASAAGAEEKPQAGDGWKFRDEINGPAPAGVVYAVKGMGVNEGGRMPTFKDGKPHSSVGSKGALDIARYTMHPSGALPQTVAPDAAGPQEPTPSPPSPEPSAISPQTRNNPTTTEADGTATTASRSDDDFPGDRHVPQGQPAMSPGDNDEIADEWEPLERNEGAAPRGVEYTLASDDIFADDTAQAYEDGEPTRRVPLRDFVTLPEYEAHPEPLEEVEAELVEEDTLISKLSKETSFAAIQSQLAGIYNDPEFKAMKDPEQHEVRANIWRVVVDIKKNQGDPIDPAASPSAFRLWSSFIYVTMKNADGADAIEGTFRTLKRSVPWMGSADIPPMSDNNKAILTKAVETMVLQMRG